MSVEIEPLKPADLPERTKAFWKMTGPGAVLVGLSIGAGEIVVWPRVAAQFGATMIWGAAVGVFLQLWVNLEIGRWTVATGESVYTGFARVWRGFAAAFVFFNVCGWIMPGWARASGNALEALLVGPNHPTPDWFWTSVTFAGVLLVLFGPTRVYSAVEKAVSALVAIVVVGLVVIAVRVATRENVAEFAEGLTRFGYIEKGYPVKEFFSALVFAGAGGTANLFYSFYLRDKHVGMGARLPELVNPFRKRAEKMPETGFLYPESEENARRFRDWFHFVKMDQTLYFWALNTFTIFLFIFGALAVLHPRGIVPGAGTLIWDQAVVLESIMGKFGRILFLLIGLATLFSTQVTLTDGVARSLSDIFAASFGPTKNADPAKLYLYAALFVVLSGVGLTAFLEYRKVTTTAFLFNAGYVGGFAMAVYSPLLLYMNLTRLPKSARPHAVNVAFMIVASAVYVGFAVFCLGTEFGLIRE